jgi:hypothetical protein
MVTREQALTEREFHYDPEGHGDPCKGPRSNLYRRNGATKTWKTRPTEFRLPVKFGLYGYHAITQDNATAFHAASECPKGS